ncbi:DUF3040 domain-containing protein [Streptomyces sp. TRM70350]|uniref:DUF3040 domain-containing protein n=1 Tax=Streptomyces sp. TRM70350 TaxID=2856165 RepID=UPI001C45F756|nr:DUF3040 domain-containing protein [Streptomyces sp. TRM70350]MBV7697543.1 DUF3040 domain-containing protein [Streptomyces sp. TRM70350]
MNPEMDEERVLAQLERRLAQDDPALAATMDALNEQFPEEPEAEPAQSHEEKEKQHDWRRTAATVLAVIAALGLFLTAVLNSSSHQGDRDPPPPKGMVPGVSVQSQRRCPPRTAPRRRRPDPGGIPRCLPAGQPFLPTGEPVRLRRFQTV